VPKMKTVDEREVEMWEGEKRTVSRRLAAAQAKFDTKVQPLRDRLEKAEAKLAALKATEETTETEPQS